MCCHLQIPVYKGCASPLIVDWRQTRSHDELSQFVIPDVDPVDTSCIQPEHASVALCRFVSQDPGRNIILRNFNLSCLIVNRCSDCKHHITWLKLSFCVAVNVIKVMCDIVPLALLWWCWLDNKKGVWPVKSPAPMIAKRCTFGNQV